MNKSIGTLVALSALVVSGPVIAGANEAKNDPDKVICKVQKRTGTRFPSRTCHTRAEWAEIAETNKRLMAEMRDRPVTEIRRDN